MSHFTRRAGAPIAGRPSHWARPLPSLGIENLHCITPTLFRSAQPEHESGGVLQDLGIKTIVSLRSFNADDEEFEQDHGLKLVRVPINTWHIRDHHVIEALQAILEAEKQGGVLLHCLHGADRTGVVSAMYRMAVQNWNKDAARQEMFYGGFGYHTVWRNIPKFIARVDPSAMKAQLKGWLPTLA